MPQSKAVSRTIKGIGIGIGALIVVLALVVAFFPWNKLRGPLARLLSADLGRPVTIAALHGSLFGHPHVQVSGFTIGNPAWAGGGQMVSIQRIELQLRFWPLLWGEIVLPRVALIQPDVRLFRATDGRANWVFSAHPESTRAKQRANEPMHLPLVHVLVIRSGRLSAHDDMHKMTFDGTVDAGEASGVSAGVPSRTAKAVKARAMRHGASASGAEQRASRVAADTGTGFKLLGKGELNDKPFTLRVSGGPLVWAETHKPYPFDVRMIASDIRFTARGVVPHPFDLGQLEMTLSLSGSDLADGYYLTGLALPNTPPYAISGHLHSAGTKFKLTDVRGKLGGSDIHGVITAQLTSPYPVINADLTSHVLNLADLGPTFGGSAPSAAEEAQERQGSGHPTKAKAKQALAKGVLHGITGKTGATAANQFLLPTAKLQVDRLRGMDATLHYHADRIKDQDLPLKKVGLTLRLQNDVLHIDPFDFTLPQGELAGTVSIDVHGPVPTEQLDIRLTHVQLAQFHTKGTAKPPFEGTLVGRLRLDGSGDSMHAFASTANGTLSVVVPHGEIEQAFAEFAGIDVAQGLGLALKKKQRQTDLRCGIADFDADQGVAKVRQVVFDTQVVLITGNGDVDLRNEKLNLQLTGSPKKFRLGVLHSPIEIRGTLLHPAVGLKGSKLAVQGAAAAVLGIVGTPLAAIAAFVDPGLNKSADCQALLADAKAMGAPLHTAQSRPRAKSAPKR
jgi:AsmA family protein